jgi:phosphoglycolate phosphatase
MIKAIIFDYDDTLVQSLKIDVIALKEVARKYYKLELTDQRIKKVWGLPYKEMLKKLFGDVDSIKNISDIYQEQLLKLQLKTEPFAVETIHRLSSKYILGIVTASEKEEVIRELTELGFDLDNFYIVQTEEDTKKHKPNPEVFAPIAKAFSKKGISIDEIIYVGDSLLDLEASQKFGIQFYAFPRGLTTKKEFKKRNVPILSSLKELLEL